MSWDFSYTLGSLTLADVAKHVIVLSEGGGGWEESTYKIPNLDGRRNDDLGTRGPMDLDLRVLLRGTNAAGAITHADGEAGHYYENLSLIKAELNGGLVALGRTAPHIGDVRAMVKLFMRPIRENQIMYRLPLSCPSGSWQDAAESSAASSAVTTSGDVRIHDPIIEFAGAGTLTHTATDGTVSSITAESGPTYPVTVDVGAGTVLDNGGADARGEVSFSQPWWLRMDPDGAQSFTGTATIRWRNRWA